MYDPVRIRRRPTGRGVVVVLVLFVAAFIAVAVAGIRANSRSTPDERLSLDELAMLVPDSAEVEVVAAMVRTRLAKPSPSPGAPEAPAAPACVPEPTPSNWDDTQRENATTITRVGVALAIPARGEVVAVATAIQESKLYNLGYLGDRNDHDSQGLFQQRPSMGWGTVQQITDPIYASTAFYLALQRVPGWETMAITDAAQRVQRSAFPYAYAKWEVDATALVRNALCTLL